MTDIVGCTDTLAEITYICQAIKRIKNDKEGYQ